MLDYDVVNGITRVIDSHGRTRFYEHAQGRVMRLIHGDGTSRTWTYNEQWQLVAEQDESGVGFYYEYDAIGRVAGDHAGRRLDRVCV